MRDISNKINDSAPSPSGYLDAQEVNSLTEELKNVVESAPGGLSLDPSTGPDSSTEMLTQSIVRHSAGGAIYCTASGNAGTHTLALTDTNVTAPSILFKGLTCRYEPPASNTGAVSVNAFGLGPRPLVNHLSAVPAANAVDGRVIDIFYDPTIGSGSWVLPAWSNALYVGQTPSSPPAINSGEGWEVGDGNLGKLNFPGLTADNVPETNDLFAFHDAGDSQHKAISYGALAGLLGAGGGLVGMQFFTSSGTYTKSANVSKAFVIVVGGGGGAGGVSNGGKTPGGGGGASVLSFIDLSNIETVDFSIGAGGAGGVGNTSGQSGGSTVFGSFARAGGGGGSQGYGQETLPGSGGIATIGIVQLDGQGGGPPTSQEGGVGGCSLLGGGGNSANHNYGKGDGGAGGRYGGGGGGADHSGTGGAGSSGCVLVLEFA